MSGLLAGRRPRLRGWRRSSSSVGCRDGPSSGVGASTLAGEGSTACASAAGRDGLRGRLRGAAVEASTSGASSALTVLRLRSGLGASCGSVVGSGAAGASSAGLVDLRLRGRGAAWGVSATGVGSSGVWFSAVGVRVLERRRDGARRVGPGAASSAPSAVVGVSAVWDGAAAGRRLDVRRLVGALASRAEASPSLLSGSLGDWLVRGSSCNLSASPVGLALWGRLSYTQCSPVTVCRPRNRRWAARGSPGHRRPASPPPPVPCPATCNRERDALLRYAVSRSHRAVMRPHWQ